MSEEDVIFNLELNVEGALSNARQIEGLMFRTLGYIQRLGLPENVNDAIRLLQRATMAVRMLHSAMIAIQVAEGPTGWWRIGLALAGTGFAAGGFASEISAELRGK